MLFPNSFTFHVDCLLQFIKFENLIIEVPVLENGNIHCPSLLLQDFCYSL